MSRGTSRMPQANGELRRERAIQVRSLERDTEKQAVLLVAGEKDTPSQGDHERSPAPSLWDRFTGCFAAQFAGGRTGTDNSGRGDNSELDSTCSPAPASAPEYLQPLVQPESVSSAGRTEVQMHSLSNSAGQIHGTASDSLLSIATLRSSWRKSFEESDSHIALSTLYNAHTHRIMQLVDPDSDRSISDTHPAQLLEWLASVVLGRPEARDRALRLQGKDAALFNGIVHECLADSSDAAIHVAVLRLLQDVCSTSGELPASYWLTDVTVNYRDCIGRGGEALVYMGTYKGSTVVVRQVSPLTRREWKSQLGQRTLTLLQREIVTHAQLRHKNIIPLLGVFREINTDPPMMILPFMEHGSAYNYLDTLVAVDSKCLALIIMGIMHNITRALAYLHTHNPPVLHGDLHPGNILIDSTGSAVLCDFGFSRIRHEITRTRTDIREGGRSRFLAPELSSGPDAFRTSQASDVYSLAMTFLALCTGGPPFEEYSRELEAMHAARLAIRPKRPPSLLFPDEYVDKLWSLMEDMWAHEPTDRPSALQVKGRIPPPHSLDSIALV